jgi:hypothetical protein
MSAKTYSDKLRDPRWQKRRLKVMEYAKWRCQICGTKDNTLHCHHSCYTRGKEPWQYPEGSIICICDGCHAKIHAKPEVKYVYMREPEPEPLHIPVSESSARSKFTALRIALMTPEERAAYEKSHAK